MLVAVCFNRVPQTLHKGEEIDRLSEEGAETEALAVAGALRELGHRAELAPLMGDALEFAGKLRALAPDAAFNLCEGFWGDSRKEMHVAALLELLGIAYSGSAPFCLGLTQDKARTKDILRRHHLPTADFVLVRPGEQFPRLGSLKYPLFVKPRFEDASLGITSESIVGSERALRKRIRYIHDIYRQGALIEEYIEGREINAAVLGAAPGEVLPLSEIRFQPGLEHSIVSYAGKWVTDSLEYEATLPICPAPLKAREAMLIRDVALRACRLLDCRDYARVDIRLREGVPYILEVNANPDISPDAGLARSARQSGLEYNQLIARILQMTLKRKETLRA